MISISRPFRHIYCLVHIAVHIRLNTDSCKLTNQQKSQFTWWTLVQVYNDITWSARLTFQTMRERFIVCTHRNPPRGTPMIFIPVLMGFPWPPSPCTECASTSTRQLFCSSVDSGTFHIRLLFSGFRPVYLVWATRQSWCISRVLQLL